MHCCYTTQVESKGVKKTVVSLVHRIKRKGKALCEYKHTSRIWSYSSMLKAPKRKKKQNHILSDINR